MTFNYTHGKKEKYVVHFYDWNLNDKYYFSSKVEARKFFMSATKYRADYDNTIITLRNLKDNKVLFVDKNPESI